MKHRQQISDLELQQDNRVAESLCDHWKVKDQLLYFVFVCILDSVMLVSSETPYLLVQEAWRVSQGRISHLHTCPVKSLSSAL